MQKIIYKIIWFILQTCLPLQRNPDEKASFSDLAAERKGEVLKVIEH